MAKLGSYDPEMGQFIEASTVKPDTLIFLRWAVANGRLHGDGFTHHRAVKLEIAPCTGNPKCDICAHCTKPPP